MFEMPSDSILECVILKISWGACYSMLMLAVLLSDFPDQCS